MLPVWMMHLTHSISIAQICCMYVGCIASLQYVDDKASISIDITNKYSIKLTISVFAFCTHSTRTLSLNQSINLIEYTTT